MSTSNHQQELIDLQNYGHDHQGMIYFTNYSIVALDLPTSFFITALVITAITKYKAKGPTLWLLIALNVGIFSFACANVFVIIATT